MKKYLTRDIIKGQLNSIISKHFNRLMPGGNKKVTHT